MLRCSDLLLKSDYKKYHFYGEQKLPATTIHTQYGDFDLSVIDYDRVNKINEKSDFYDYGHALTQVIYGKANANIIAFILDKIGYCDFFFSDNNDTHLYMCVKFK